MSFLTRQVIFQIFLASLANVLWRPRKYVRKIALLSYCVPFSHAILITGRETSNEDAQYRYGADIAYDELPATFINPEHQNLSIL